MEHVGTKEIVPYQLYVPPLEGSLLEVLLYITCICITSSTLQLQVLFSELVRVITLYIFQQRTSNAAFFVLSHW